VPVTAARTAEVGVSDPGAVVSTLMSGLVYVATLPTLSATVYSYR
jgi:hypothetical protein